MNNHSNTDNDHFEDTDTSWDSLFDMAGSYEDMDESFEYDDTDFYETPVMEQDSYDIPVINQEHYDSPEEALKVLFGYDSFRTGQKEIIDSILSGRDAFAVMPTGAGKSVCYQIPALLLPGVTLVISPLISLMQDQVKALNEAGVSAGFINSSLSDSAFMETVRRARQGIYKILYVAPERLMTDSFLSLAMDIQISMITVDEAHCISQWGQDFRPSYMKIVEFVRLLPDRPILSAFTATATENVRDDIVCTLGLQNPYCLVTGFDRENLFFQVDKPKNKDQYILKYLSEHSGESGIIYCATRKNVDKLYELLASRGVSVARYHAGLGAAERKRMQDEFVFDYISVVIATNAFGMGIDKSNVRFVIHYNMPQSMENYYQEAGRAGRDGSDAKCTLLFSPQDIMINRFLLEHKEMTDLDAADQQTVRERDTKRLQVMERYCYTTECLRNYILKYFGENPEKPCEDCGNCLREFETMDMTDAAKQIINCVFEAKGRYGKTIIIDTVAGAKTARLEEIGSVNYKTYGVLAKTNRNLLRRLIEQMVLEGYLVVGDYQVIRLGDISRLKDPEAKVLVKITDDDKLPSKTPKAKTKAKGMADLSSAGYKLFDKLRALRLEIAREESMPPYIIFSDKTLVDMAVRVPESKSEMLAVSGVGENKYMKYGERFLAAIDEGVREYPELLRSKAAQAGDQETEFAGYEENLDTSAAAKKKPKKTGKMEFHLTEEEAENFQYTDFYNVSAIRDELNASCRRENVKKLAATRITEFLTAEDLIIEQETGGIYAKVPTEKGTEFGIKVTRRISENGTEYSILMYPKSVQEMIVSHYTGEEAASRELEQGEQRRATHAGANKLWTAEEEGKLTDEYHSGRYSVADLAKLHGRTSGAIRSRLAKLGLIQ